jgi:hypothetical protein
MELFPTQRYTPAARQLTSDSVCVHVSINVKHLMDTWQELITFSQEAAALGILKKNGTRPRNVRVHIEQGLAVVHTLLWQSNTVHHINTFGRPDTREYW